MGVRAALLTAGLQRSLRLPWAIARPGRRRSTAACCCLPRTMPSTLRASISRTSSHSKYLLSNNQQQNDPFSSVPMGSGVVFYLRGNT